MSEQLDPKRWVRIEAHSRDKNNRETTLGTFEGAYDEMVKEAVAVVEAHLATRKGDKFRLAHEWVWHYEPIGNDYSVLSLHVPAYLRIDDPTERMSYRDEDLLEECPDDFISLVDAFEGEGGTQHIMETLQKLSEYRKARKAKMQRLIDATITLERKGEIEQEAQ